MFSNKTTEKVKAILSSKRLNEKLKFIKEIYKMSKLDDLYRNIKLEFAGGYLYITAMNPMCCVKTHMEVLEHDLQFCVLVDAESFISVIGRYSVDLILEFLPNNNLTIKHDSGYVNTKWFPFGKLPFPSIYEQSGESVSYKCSDFVPFLKKSFMFTREDEFMINLSMTYISIDDEYINVFSTDRFAIYVHREKNGNKIKSSDISINSVSASILYGMAAKSNGEVRVSSDDRITYLSFDDTLIYNVNPEHKMPNFRNVMNAYKPDIKAVVNKDILKDVISKCAIDDKLTSTIYLGKEKSGIKSSDPSKGLDLVEYFINEFMEGQNISFDIRLKRIKDAISCFGSKSITIEVSSESKFLRVSDPDGREKEFVLLSTYKN